MAVRRLGEQHGLTFTPFPACPDGHHALAEELTPRLFSFNHHSGACPRCAGLGSSRELDPERFFTHRSKPLFRGGMDHRGGKWLCRTKGRVRKVVTAAFEAAGLDVKLPLAKYSRRAWKLLMEGSGERSYRVRYRAGPPGHRFWKHQSTWEGLPAVIRRWYERAQAPSWRQQLEERMSSVPCPDCQGARLRPDLRAVRVGGRGGRPLRTSEHVRQTAARQSEAKATGSSPGWLSCSLSRSIISRKDMSGRTPSIR